MTRAGTLGELRASGWESRPVKEEVRANALARISSGKPLVDGVIGFDDTVLPQLENALLAGHDVIFLAAVGWDFLWATVFWGLGLVLHGASVFFSGSDWVKRWEHRAIQKELDRQSGEPASTGSSSPPPPPPPPAAPSAGDVTQPGATQPGAPSQRASAVKKPT